MLTGLTSVINELGYACDHALTTVVAANLLAARRYDAVLIDIQMPGKNGAELAAETRAGKGPNRETRLLGMSAAEVTARYEHGPVRCLPDQADRPQCADQRTESGLAGDVAVEHRLTTRRVGRS